MQGIELREVHGTPFDAAGTAPSTPTNAAATVRSLFEKNLQIPCLDAVCDLSDRGACEDNRREIAACMETARNLSVPYVRIHATGEGEGAAEAAADCLAPLVPLAEERGVTLLLETVGAFSDTARLRDVLNRFASDRLAALWDLHHPYRDRGREPETTIQNLGAYVRHVHVKDSVVEEGGRVQLLSHRRGRPAHGGDDGGPGLHQLRRLYLPGMGPPLDDGTHRDGGHLHPLCHLYGALRQPLPGPPPPLRQRPPTPATTSGRRTI